MMFNYSSFGSYSQAIEYYEQALEIARKLNDNDMVLLERLGSSYSALREYDKAVEYYKQALAASQRIEINPSNRLIPKP